MEPPNHSSECREVKTSHYTLIQHSESADYRSHARHCMDKEFRSALIMGTALDIIITPAPGTLWSNGKKGSCGHWSNAGLCGSGWMTLSFVGAPRLRCINWWVKAGYRTGATAIKTLLGVFPQTALSLTYFPKEQIKFGAFRHLNTFNPSLILNPFKASFPLQDNKVLSYYVLAFNRDWNEEIWILTTTTTKLPMWSIPSSISRQRTAGSATSFCIIVTQVLC